MAVDVAEFKKALGSWASGVSIVTTKLGDAVSGMTVSAFNSVSADPPIVLVCINKSATSCPLIKESGNFGVNILQTGQQNASNDFANFKTKDTRWNNVKYSTAVTGAPLLDDAMAVLDCKVIQAVDAGSHTVFFGSVEAVEVREGDPLMYFRGGYRTVGDLL